MTQYPADAKEQHRLKQYPVHAHLRLRLREQAMRKMTSVCTPFLQKISMPWIEQDILAPEHAEYCFLFSFKSKPLPCPTGLIDVRQSRQIFLPYLTHVRFYPPYRLSQRQTSPRVKAQALSASHAVARSG